LFFYAWYIHHCLVFPPFFSVVTRKFKIQRAAVCESYSVEKKTEKHTTYWEKRKRNPVTLIAMAAISHDPPTGIASLGLGDLSHRITPPGAACRILPLFAPPGCHFYDSYFNCFRHRPEVRPRLLDAAQRHEAHRLAALHTGEQHHHFQDGAPASTSARKAPSPCTGDDWPSWHLRAGLPGHLAHPCQCGLRATQLFASSHDVPYPALPLSKCELHEVLLSLPPRWQNYPWKLCFDTARDGFSLSSLYRSMADLEEQQTRSKTVAFGLFFVHTRDDAPLHSMTVAAYPSASGVAGGDASLTDAATPTTASSSRYTSPVATGNSKSFRTAHHSSSMRYGASRGTLPYSVIGCFTPEVPSLAHHAANIYYGSAESTVFRLDQLGLSAQRGEWMLRAFEAAAAAAESEEAATTVFTTEAREAVRREVGVDSDTTNSAGTLRSLRGFARMVDSAEQTRVPVPMPTYVTIEQRGKSAPSAAGSHGALAPAAHAAAAVASPSSRAACAGTSSADASPVPPLAAAACDAPFLATVSPASSKPTSPTHSNAVRRSLRASPVKGVVPCAPLLSKYGWSGRQDNRKFVVCNPHFFALGAGKSGAALHVDEALQFGTSSHWCETFNAPCLFGPRAAQGSPSASALSSPCKARPSSTPTTTTTTAAAAAPPQLTFPARAIEVTSASPGSMSSLPHREFAISRVVWFAITEDKRAFRLMNGTGAGAGAKALAAYDDDTRCWCGRTSWTGEQEGRGGYDVSTPVGVSYMHKCDLLPFTEQPY
jgi:hypothetical protein